MKAQKIGLYFGSFNPIHIGHLAIANYFVEFTDIEQLWFVVSPQNPLKNKSSLLAEHHRFEMVRLAVEDSQKYQVSNIEFHLPKPTYTIDTLTYLQDKYPKNSFILIMGSDNIENLPQWKNYEILLKYYKILVYPRPNYEAKEWKKHKNISFVSAPQMDISSSFIRQSIKEKKDMRFFVPQKAFNYLTEMHFYEK